MDPELAAAVDTGNAPLAQPDQHHGVGAVEQFGAHTAGTAFGIGLHTAQRADHGDFLASLAVDCTVGAGAGGLTAELHGVTLFGALQQPAGDTANKTFGRSHGLSCCWITLPPPR